MRCLLLSLVLIFAAACSGYTERARVAIPKSKLVLVVLEDEKNMLRYRFLADQAEVSEQGFLGPKSSAVSWQPTVTQIGSVTRFDWGDPSTLYIEFDLASCKIVKHSNPVSAPPKLSKCE